MQLIILWNSVQTIEEIFNLTIVNKKAWRTCYFPVWERVKHIVSVYNAHTPYQIKNLGKILRIIQP
jgi:hypothetical protein